MKRLDKIDINSPEFFDNSYQGIGIEKKQRREVREKKEILSKNVKDGMRVIELGCGNTELLPELKKKYPNCEIYGLDYSKVIIERLAEDFPEIKYQLGDALKTPYEDNYFDCVMAAELIEHIEKPSDLIREMARICKKDGVISITCPCMEDTYRKSYPGHLWELDEKDMKELFSEYGRTDIEITPYDKPIYRYPHLIVNCYLSEKPRVHFIQTVFTGRGKPKRQQETERWLNKRIVLFKQYTIPSLLNQTNRNFTHWISFRNKEDENSPLIKELSGFLKRLHYDFLFTFDGQPYWDDRAPNETLKERLKESLKFLEPYCRNKEYVYLTMLDSDDMFHKEVVSEIQNETFRNKGALIYQKGLVFNHETSQFADWFCESPPFYTLMYLRETFLDASKKLEYDKPFTTHEDIIKYFDYKILSENRYCYLVHGDNKSTYWKHPFQGKEYSDEERNKILKDFAFKL